MNRALDLIAGINLRNPFLDPPNQVELTVKIRDMISSTDLPLRHPPVSFNAVKRRRHPGQRSSRTLYPGAYHRKAASFYADACRAIKPFPRASPRINCLRGARWAPGLSVCPGTLSGRILLTPGNVAGIFTGLY